MSFLGQVLGGSGGKAGQFEAQAPTNVQNPLTQDQINQQYQNAQAALKQQMDFAQMVGAVNGLGNQQNVFGQQQALANQLQQQANGEGPNPALAQLNQTTGQNVAQQAALMAGQRGSGSNAGLIARQIGQQGAGIQQQAAGQAATLRAQQQLAAQQALQGQQAQLAAMANQQTAQQANAIQGFNQYALEGQKNAYGAYNQGNATQAGVQSDINNTNASIARGNQAMQGAITGGLIGAAGTAMTGGGGAGSGSTGGRGGFTAAAQAHGGMIEEYAQGGDVAPSGSFFGQALKMLNGGPVPGAARMAGDNLKNDTVPAMLSPGEIVLPRTVVQHPNAPQEAAKFVAAVMAKKGLR